MLNGQDVNCQQQQANVRTSNNSTVTAEYVNLKFPDNCDCTSKHSETSNVINS